MKTAVIVAALFAGWLAAGYFLDPRTGPNPDCETKLKGTLLCPQPAPGPR